MEMVVRQFFERYERFFNRSLIIEFDAEELASLYATEFIGAGPIGVRAGRNDDGFRQAMAQGYEHYRAMGTKEMRLRDIHLSPIDPLHCLAHVSWTATYARMDRPDTAIDFEVHYLIQILAGEPRVFGWISGDEQALLKKHGIT